MNNSPIGIIDSGVGGLSIASVLIKNFPNESFTYLADSKNCPYGQKSRQEIYKLSKKMIDFLLKQDIKLLVVACNTITVTCISLLRKDYPKLPIMGIVPVVKTAVKMSKSKKIGVFSTKVTAESVYQKDLINKFAKGYSVVSLGSAELVSLIEKMDFEAIDKVLKKELELFRSVSVDTLALGCSHFPLIKTRIEKQLPSVLILDSSEAVSHQVRRILEHNKLLSKNTNPSYNFYTTGDSKSFNFYVRELTPKGKIERIQL